ncbi:MAG: 16S rRNA (guanine(966)-N(2))-methyltransferase RsmD [Bdellovibrionales bacterium]
MRVISGRFKGRRLAEFEAGHIRPTTDRVKETLFNKLIGRVEGARVLDLFSGTGSLAIECLSRGAAWVDLVESHPKSLAIVRDNLERLDIRSGYKVHAVDVFRFIARFHRAERGDSRLEPYNLVLADPPFTRAWAHDLAVKIGQSRVLAEAGWLVIEASSKERMDDVYPGLIRLDQRRFGDKHLNFFARDPDHADKGDLSRQF